MESVEVFKGGGSLFHSHCIVGTTVSYGTKRGKPSVLRRDFVDSNFFTGSLQQILNIVYTGDSNFKLSAYYTY